MKNATIIVFPGTNRETDMAHALKLAGFHVSYTLYNEKKLPDNTDLVALAGGFSYGDYLRSGAIAANTNIIEPIKEYAENGGYILGVCNGFQILCEIGLLPGTLIHNNTGRFICKTVDIEIINIQSTFTHIYQQNQIVNLPVAHGEGHYFADDSTIKQLQDNNQILFQYCNNPNGSLKNIAGITNKAGNIMGMMPHPENHVDPYQKNTNGLGIFNSLMASLIK